MDGCVPQGITIAKQHNGWGMIRQLAGCVPQAMTIAKQHNGCGMIGEHLLFTSLFLEDVDII